MFEPRLDGARLVRLQGVLAGERALLAAEHDHESPEVEVVRAQQPDLAGPQAVPVCQEEDGPVAPVGDAREEALCLVGREELDRLSAAGAIARARGRSLGCRRSSPAVPPADFLRLAAIAARVYHNADQSLRLF